MGVQGGHKYCLTESICLTLLDCDRLFQVIHKHGSEIRIGLWHNAQSSTRSTIKNQALGRPLHFVC